MSDLEDGLAESQTKIKTVDKYKTKIAEMTKELRRYLDEVRVSADDLENNIGRGSIAHELSRWLGRHVIEAGFTLKTSKF